MPWHLEDDNSACDGIAVVKDDDGEIEGCHTGDNAEEEAKDQLAALYASERRQRKQRIRLVLEKK